MRVAQLMAGATNGGAELFFERLCAGLAAAGDDVLPLIRDDASRVARLQAAGLHPARFRFGNALDVLTRHRIRRALARFAPRVAVAWMGRAARHAPAGPWVLVGRLGGYYDLRQFARCDHLVGNSHAVVEWIRAQGRFPADRVHYLPNFSPDLAGAMPAALPMIPAEAPKILALGRLHRNKGFDLFIGAVSRISGLHAAIAGDGPERVALERLARHAGVADRVHFLGWRDDTAALLAACDALVCPSRSEALGNVVLEAFSARRPVVASMAEGPRELIEAGRTGVLVAQESAIALAAGIEGVLRNPVQSAAMVNAARLRYEEMFSEDAVIKRWRSFSAPCGKALMCGIAGLALAPSAPPPDPAVLEAMMQALRHRGPDGSGRVVIGQAALAHTRLAIIDLPGGDQPFFAGPAALIANGEIYNFRELRADMPGVVFSSNSDCEPPLHLFREHGSHFADRLRGMYAISIHDRAARTLTLSRDPFGIKPLYYTQIAEGFAFASEPQALLAAGLARREIRAGARDELLQTQFSSGAETIFPGIFRLLPGETIEIADGRLVEHRRIAALPEGPPEDISLEAALARLDRALMESVELHQRSDVPYGMFLSGGIDSSAILAVMARLNDRPVLAFTAGFDVPGAADERAQAERIANSVGAQHEKIDITQKMVWQHLPAIVAAMDDPAADYAIIPSWFLARRARRDVKVVLSGEGGDEIFGGYGRYRSAMRPWYFGGKALRAHGSFDRLDVLRARPIAWRDGLAAAELLAASPGRSRMQVAQATDIADWLPHDLLVKLDRCLMAHGVEGRTPFLDPAVAAAGFRLPDSLKARDGRGKFLLRSWLASALPASQPFAPKQGFTVPVGSWIAADGARLGKLVAAQPGVAEIAVPERVEAVFKAASGKREGMAAWLLLFYALWHRAHIENLPFDGSLMDVLAAR